LQLESHKLKFHVNSTL